VLRSLPLEPGDTLVVTSHEYNATRNIVDFVAADRGCRVEMAEIPFPLERPEQAAHAVLSRIDARTRLLVVDHVTSQTALVLPLAQILEGAARLGVPVLVDAAHAPGMLDVDISALAPAYYMGNCHKWLCAPKGAGFLYVRRDLQDEVRPATISHGANAGLRGPERFRIEFDWMGTDDPTPALCVPDALEHLASLVPGGWPEIRERNRALCLAARRVVADALAIDLPCPDEMIGSLASLPLPESARFAEGSAGSALDEDPLASALYDRYGIQVPILGSRAFSGRLMRISCQLYNQLSDYEKLAAALRSLL
jgi:isopenicillin-N epimerase